MSKTWCMRARGPMPCKNLRKCCNLCNSSLVNKRARDLRLRIKCRWSLRRSAVNLGGLLLWCWWTEVLWPAAISQWNIFTDILFQLFFWNLWSNHMITCIDYYIWQPYDCLMIDCSVTVWSLLNDVLMTVWWLHYDCLTTVQWLFDDCWITFDDYLQWPCLITLCWLPVDCFLTA